MNKTTQALLKADLISYLISGLVLLGGGICALSMDNDANSLSKNVEEFYLYGGLFVILVGTVILILALVKARDVFAK